VPWGTPQAGDRSGSGEPSWVSLFDKLQRRPSDDDVELPHVSDEELLAWASELQSHAGGDLRRARRLRPLVADPA